MSFQSFFFYLGKIAENLGVTGCKPKDFQTAKCLVKAIADSTDCTGGLKDSVTLTNVTLVNGQTFTYIATGREFYVFSKIVSTNNNQSIKVNGVTVDTLLNGSASVIDLCNGDTLTVVDPATGSGASWSGINIPFLS